MGQREEVSKRILRNEAIDKIWGDLAEIQDLSTLIQVAAHGTQYMGDKTKFLGVVETGAKISAKLISKSLSDLEDVKKL